MVSVTPSSSLSATMRAFVNRLLGVVVQAVEVERYALLRCHRGSSFRGVVPEVESDVEEGL